MKAMLIINPKAGKRKGKMPPLFKWTFKKLKTRLVNVSTAKTTAEDVVREVKRRCRKEKIQLRIEYITHQNHALELSKAAKNKYNLIIVAGGDGTVNQVINGIANSRTTLAIIPFGTVNVLALELKIPFDVKKAAELISNGKKIKMDLGFAKTDKESRYFSIVLSVGFDSAIIKKVKLKSKKRWGRYAFSVEGIKQLFKYKWENIHVYHNSHSIGYFVVVANTKDYAGEYEIADKASTTDGLLDLIVINRKNWWKIAKFLIAFSSGKRKKKFLKGEYTQIKKAHIFSKKKLVVQVDGEVMGETPVDIEVASKALRIMVKK